MEIPQIHSLANHLMEGDAFSQLLKESAQPLLSRVWVVQVKVTGNPALSTGYCRFLGKHTIKHRATTRNYLTIARSLINGSSA